MKCPYRKNLLGEFKECLGKDCAKHLELIQPKLVDGIVREEATEMCSDRWTPYLLTEVNNYLNRINNTLRGEK